MSIRAGAVMVVSGHNEEDVTREKKIWLWERRVYLISFEIVVRSVLRDRL